MNVAAGEIQLYVYADGYFYEYTESFNISENETAWVNISLDPRPEENSVVEGYIRDAVSGDGIGDAFVELTWRDNQGHYYWKFTTSYSTGRYTINVAAGEIQLDVYAEDYHYFSSPWYNIGENETLIINVNMTPMFNYPPYPPSIKGEINGNIKTDYEYTFNSTDPNGDNVKYYVDWGDGNTEWTGFNESGVEVILTHSWSEKGNYSIRAYAVDIYGEVSDWGFLEVTMPKSYNSAQVKLISSSEVKISNMFIRNN
jgi:hypothetical protein